MKKVINSKLYDSGTAKLIGSWSNSALPTDAAYFKETLHRKRTGEFFLHCEGGASSKYSVSCGDNQWSSGEEIIPLSYEAAQKWGKDHLSSDVYHSIFCPDNDDDTKMAITFSLSVSTINRIKLASSKTGMSLSAYIESLIP